MGLDGFSERGGRQRRPSGLSPAQPNRTGPTQRGAPDPDRCPPGWDTDVWHLALLFQQYARADGIELRQGRPIIYTELKSLIDHYKVRDQKFVQEVRGCRNRFAPTDWAAHCWLHWPPDDPKAQRPGPVTWVQKMEVLQAEFWSRIQDEHALDAFRQYFREYGNMILQHWKSLRHIRAIDELRKEAPEPTVRRRITSDTMADEQEDA